MKKQSKIITLLLLVAALTITSITSCKKDVQPDQTKPITIMVKTEGLHIEQMKSFDLSQWQYQYNPNSYELRFEGSKGKIFTFQKTIQELKAGFAVSVLPDSYTITYTTLHGATATANAPLDNVLDIVISESKNITTLTDLILQAQNDDFLVIMDNNSTNANISYYNPLNNTTNNLYFFNSPDPQNQTYKYMYWNREGDFNINYRDVNNDPKEKTIINAKKGNVYHIVSAVNGNNGINITGMNYNMIGW